VLRFLLWRLLGVLAILAGFALVAWFLDGGPGKLLRGHGGAHVLSHALAAVPSELERCAAAIWSWAPASDVAPVRLLLAACALLLALAVLARLDARRRRRYVRMRVDAYRGDHASIEAVAAMLAALHKRLLRRWWRRLLFGQPRGPSHGRGAALGLAGDRVPRGSRAIGRSLAPGSVSELPAAPTRA
jgi:hypothetical protein